MADTFVLWTPFPHPVGERYPLRAVYRRAGLADPEQTGWVRKVALADAAGAPERSRWSRRRRPAALVQISLKLAPEREQLFTEKNLVFLRAFVAALGSGRGNRLVLALTPPTVLVEQMWRTAVWSGEAVTLDEVTASRERAVHQAYDRLLEATAAVKTRELATTLPAGWADDPASDDPVWQLSARGVEILRRMNAHAAGDKERAWMRDFCVANFARAGEPGSAHDDLTARRLLTARQATAALWGPPPGTPPAQAAAPGSAASEPVGHASEAV